MGYSRHRCEIEIRFPGEKAEGLATFLTGTTCQEATICFDDVIPEKGRGTMNEANYMANWDGATTHTDTMIPPTTCGQLAAIAEQHVGNLHRLGLHVPPFDVGSLKTWAFTLDGKRQGPRGPGMI